MIKIKAAMKKAAGLSEKAKNLKKRTVNRWSKEGIISEVQDYEVSKQTGGRSGLYPDDLPIEIAVAAELKGKYKLDLIVKVRKNIKESIKQKSDHSIILPKYINNQDQQIFSDPEVDKQEYPISAAQELSSYINKQSNILKEIADCDNPGECRELIEEYNEIKDLVEAEKDYLDLYKKFGEEV